MTQPTIILEKACKRREETLMSAASKRPMIIVHGGAGSWKDERIGPGLETVTAAARYGFSVLKETGSILDAAEACTVFMEASGRLNAGIGATKNTDNEVELDAMIVDGRQLKSGAVMAVKGIQHPISLARYVLEHTPHSQFAGDGLQKLYKRMIEEGYRREVRPGVTTLPFDTGTADTVGCIVVDDEGNIACTSSTGGISQKMPGRVGDSPIFGAGAYANRVCGATATGQGEHIIRVLLCSTIVHYVEQGDSPQRAAERGIQLLARETGSEAGVIVADQHGNYGAYTNAKAMPVAIIQNSDTNLNAFVVWRDPLSHS